MTFGRALVGGISLLLCLSFTAGCKKKAKGTPTPDVVAPAGDPAPPSPPGEASPAPATKLISDETCARVKANSAKIAGVPVESMDAPGETGCGDITQPLADCILAATDIPSLEACKPESMRNAQPEMDKLQEDAKKYFDDNSK